MTEKNCNASATAHKLSGLTLLIGCLSLGVSACSSINVGSVNPVNWITPYKIDVIQGNFVSKEQIEALKVGLTRQQVKDVMGTPLLSSLFHADRWDYVFTLKRQGVESQSFKYTLFFKGDALERFEGDAMPSEAEFIATLATARKFGKPPVLEATEAQLKAAEKTSISKAATDGAAQSSAGQPDPTQVKVYPPLESVAR